MFQTIHPARHRDPAGTGLSAVADGQMWASASKQGSLRESGLSCFDAVMHYLDGECLRTLSDRENWYLKLHDHDGTSCGAYLKKHRCQTWWTRIRAWLKLGPGETAGRVEARNVRRLEAEGIRVMELLAYGERLATNGQLESFLLTEELVGYEELQAFIERRFPGVVDKSNKLVLEKLIHRVARITARLHQAGYNHRDLYCCHFLVREPLFGEFDIRLIDLQRVQFRQRWRDRWIVKDLAQLAFSAPVGCLRATQRLAFIKQYLGVSKLRSKDKRLIGRVLAKQRRMQRRVTRKQLKSESGNTGCPTAQPNWPNCSPAVAVASRKETSPGIKCPPPCTFIPSRPSGDRELGRDA